jgi:phospholipid-binding lipoprotein MlaA
VAAGGIEAGPAAGGMQVSALIRASAGAMFLLLLTGCATTTSMGTQGDPLERVNRATHRFNDSIDRALLRPIATGYRDHVPKPVQEGIDNVLEHLAFPTTIVNDLLQLKLKDTLVDVGRFAVNTAFGLGGILDPASAMGIPKNDEDFGQTLGRWGVPPGPYVVIPFLGPSSLRDAPSLYVDGQTDLRVALHIDNNVEWGLATLSLIHRRAELLPFDASFDAAFDRYAFIRNAWLQRRVYQVKDGDVPDDIPLEELEEAEDPGADEMPAPEETPAPDQPPAPGASSSATSLMPASEAMARGTFR